MRALILTLAILLLSSLWQFLGVWEAAAQSTPEPTPNGRLETEHPGEDPQIISPRAGEALQGSVPIVVETTMLNFQSVELTFRYSADLAETWFLIYQGIRPVTGTMLVLWETSKITDGDYILRMEVKYTDGSSKNVLVPNIRVRNYTPVETETPAPIPPSATPVPVLSASPTAVPTATALIATAAPPQKISNPIEIQRADVITSASKGALLMVGFFALGGIYHLIFSRDRKK